jgi:hypothetical protein
VGADAADHGSNECHVSPHIPHSVQERQSAPDVKLWRGNHEEPRAC